MLVLSVVADGIVLVAAICALGRHRLLDPTAGLARGARCVLLRSAFGNGPLPCSRPCGRRRPSYREKLFTTSVQLKMSNRDFSKTARRNTYF